jgi:hypothetical protein
VVRATIVRRLHGGADHVTVKVMVRVLRFPAASWATMRS